MELLEQLIEFTANGGNYVKPETTEAPATEVIIKQKPQPTRNYDADIEALSVFYQFEPGTTITIELQDLLLICERDRKRKDAYQGLIRELSKRGVTLIIKSRKTK